MPSTGCGTESVDIDAACGGCANKQRDGNANEPARHRPPAIFQVGQAMQQQAVSDRNKRWKRAQRIWSHCAMACTLIMIIFVIGNQ